MNRQDERFKDVTFNLVARNNLRKWGLQDFETLGLAIAEESGEIAQAILQAKYEGKDSAKIMEEAIDLGALCVQLVWRYLNQ